jgi:hypothetical protein
MKIFTIRNSMYEQGEPFAVAEPLFHSVELENTMSGSI